MLIDDISYNVENYRLRFRLTKRKILLIAIVATLAVALSMGIAHADPTYWMTWGGGGGKPQIRL